MQYYDSRIGLRPKCPISAYNALATGERKEHPAENDKRLHAMREDESDRVHWVDRQDHLRPSHHPGQAEQRDDREPK